MSKCRQILGSPSFVQSLFGMVRILYDHATTQKVIEDFLLVWPDLGLISDADLATSAFYLPAKRHIFYRTGNVPVYEYRILSRA